MSQFKDFQPVWDIGVYDAHCHPTDIMDSIGSISSMKAKVLTVMSTRSQDQELVAQTAKEFIVQSQSELEQGVVNDDINGQSSKDKKATDSAESNPKQEQLNETEFGHASANTKIVPAFGWHPWFSHQIIDDSEGVRDLDNIDADAHYRAVITPLPDAKFLKSLPKPLVLSKFLSETESRLQKFPLALVGEIGLDRSFRIPESPKNTTGGDDGAYTPGSREGRPLTPYKVSLGQQKMVLKAQLELAAKHNRPVSVHSVQAHGMVLEVLQSLWKGHERPSKRKQKKQKDAANAFDTDSKASEEKKTESQKLPFPPRVCMHSFSGPPETLKLFLDPKIPSDMFISFSECINFNSPSWKKAADAIRAVPDDKILIESDLHCAGHDMDQLLEKIVRRVCEIKGWTLEEGAYMLKRNWMNFIFGTSSGNG